MIVIFVWVCHHSLLHVQGCSLGVILNSLWVYSSFLGLNFIYALTSIYTDFRSQLYFYAFNVAFTAEVSLNVIQAQTLWRCK